MKKVLILVAALFVGIQAHAQLQADGGYQHIFEIARQGDQSETDGWDGLFVGARYNIRLSSLVDGLSVQPGLNFSFAWSGNSNIKNVYARNIAINIPVHVAYTYAVTSDFKVIGFAGPTLQFGLLNQVVNKTDNPTTYTNLYKQYTVAGTTVAARTPFNFYLGLGAGFVLLERFTLNAGIDFGLLNLTTGTGYKINWNVLKVGVGYIF